MDITSFILGLKNGKANGSGSIYHKFSEAMLRRNCDVLTGDGKVFKMQNFKMQNGQYLGNIQPYTFSGFYSMEFFRFLRIMLINEYAFYGNEKLKLIDVSPSSYGLISFYPNSLTGCTALETIIVRKEGEDIANPIFREGYDEGASSNFYIYVPAESYDTAVANSTNIASGAAARMRKLEDYPSIDKWDVKVTASFYDGDTLITTRTTNFGTAPSSPTATKAGYKLVRWEPAISELYGDATYQAVWEPIPFAEASWADISAITKSGKAAEAYNVGDSKQITLNYSDGTSDTVNMVIIETRRKNKAGEPTIILKNDILLSKKTTKSYTTVLDNTVFPALPADLQAVATEVERFDPVWGNQYSKCTIPALFGYDLGMNKSTYSRYSVGSGYEQYIFEYYLGKDRTANKMCTADGTYCPWWTREFYESGSYSGLYVVDASGAFFGETSTSREYNICFLIAV